MHKTNEVHTTANMGFSTMAEEYIFIDISFIICSPSEESLMNLGMYPQLSFFTKR